MSKLSSSLINFVIWHHTTEVGQITRTVHVISVGILDIEFRRRHYCNTVPDRTTSVPNHFYSHLYRRPGPKTFSNDGNPIVFVSNHAPTFGCDYRRAYFAADIRLRALAPAVHFCLCFTPTLRHVRFVHPLARSLLLLNYYS